MDKLVNIIIESIKEKEDFSQEKLDELREKLEEVGGLLGEVIQEAKEAARIAMSIGGEVDRVVAGQLEAYLIGHLSAFKDDESQAGSVEHLLRFLDEEVK